MRGRRLLLVAGLMLAVVSATGLCGCARGGPTGPVTPQVVMDFTATMAGPINDAFYYFIPLDADGDFGVDGPIPVAAGPFWQNGWGTGSFTHYVEYHLGQYNVYQVRLEPTLRTAGGGLVAVVGLASQSGIGTHTVTVQSLALGAVTVAGTGMVTAVANQALQAAGTLTLQTDAAGQVVAGSAVFTPAASGGRALIPAEQAVLTALNAGGAALQPDSLLGLGLRLTLGPAQAGSQTLTIAPTTAATQDVFVATATGQTTTQAGTLTANAQNTVGPPSVTQVTVTTADLIVGGTAIIDVNISPVATLLGPPFDATAPAGGNTLRVTVDLAMLGANIPDLSVNFITTNELIFDPGITDPNLHSYDALGALGNRYVTFRTTQYQTIDNSSGLFEREGPGDTTLLGPTTQSQRDSIDIVDWSITIRRLR
jgi:hypothetical protein